MSPVCWERHPRLRPRISEHLLLPPPLLSPRAGFRVPLRCLQRTRMLGEQSMPRPPLPQPQDVYSSFYCHCPALGNTMNLVTNDVTYGVTEPKNILVCFLTISIHFLTLNLVVSDVRFLCSFMKLVMYLTYFTSIYWAPTLLKQCTYCIYFAELGGLRHKDSTVRSSLWHMQAHGFDVSPNSLRPPN